MLGQSPVGFQFRLATTQRPAKLVLYVWVQQDIFVIFELGAELEGRHVARLLQLAEQPFALLRVEVDNGHEVIERASRLYGKLVLGVPLEQIVVDLVARTDPENVRVLRVAALANQKKTVRAALAV